jgi:hypothetical protein
MESTFNNFESIVDAITFDNQQSDFAVQTLNFPGGEDDDDSDNEDKNNGDDKSNAADDDNPPLDGDVVHSPLPTQPGGKPKTGRS